MSKLRIPSDRSIRLWRRLYHLAALATARTPLKISLASGGSSERQQEPQFHTTEAQAAYRYIQYGRFQEALNALAGTQTRDGQWY
ncbi:MAG: hypothetical protein ACLU9S_13225 [Oscillospiraceae bacterium]